MVVHFFSLDVFSFFLNPTLFENLVKKSLMSDSIKRITDRDPLGNNQQIWIQIFNTDKNKRIKNVSPDKRIE